MNFQEFTNIRKKCQRVLETNNVLKIVSNEKPDSDKIIPKTIFDTIKYLSEKGINSHGIFRIPGDDSKLKSIAKLLNDNIEIEFTKININDLASALKYYIRVILGGIFKEKSSFIVLEEFRNMHKNLNNDDLEKINITTLHMLTYALFHSLNEKEKELFLNLKDLINRIDLNSKKTEMEVSDCAMIFAPTIFEVNATNNDKIEEMKEVLSHMFKIDLMKIPEGFLEYIEQKE